MPSTAWRRQARQLGSGARRTAATTSSTAHRTVNRQASNVTGAAFARLPSSAPMNPELHVTTSATEDSSPACRLSTSRAPAGTDAAGLAGQVRATGREYGGQRADDSSAA